MVSKSIIDVLAERAEQQPDDISYTFIDYDVDPAGFAEPLTWAQLYNRVQVVAGELRKLGKVGDRAAILAPQSLEYIVGFLGALQAGFVAVPLSVPMMGVHDERATAVLKDCTPTVVLTTSAAVDAVMPSLASVPGATIVELDALDLDSPALPFPGTQELAKTAFLQYTSGSTRTPAGVMVTHAGLMENMRQIQADWFEDFGKDSAPRERLRAENDSLRRDMALMRKLIANFCSAATQPRAEMPIWRHADLREYVNTAEKYGWAP